MKVTLTLNHEGQITHVEPEGKSLKVARKSLGIGEDQYFIEGVDRVTNLTILGKPGHSPCCIINGGDVWCWC